MHHLLLIQQKTAFRPVKTFFSFDNQRCTDFFLVWIVITEKAEQNNLNYKLHLPWPDSLVDWWSVTHTIGYSELKFVLPLYQYINLSCSRHCWYSALHVCNKGSLLEWEVSQHKLLKLNCSTSTNSQLLWRRQNPPFLPKTIFLVPEISFYLILTVVVKIQSRKWIAANSSTCAQDKYAINCVS